MNKDKFKRKATRPLVWAHRGASAYAPENTLPAFQKAVELGADGVELDVQLTADGELVVIHDEWLERVSNGKGWVKDHTLAQLREYNYNRACPGFEKAQIPTLREVYELLGPSGLTINVELKTGILPYPGLAEKVVALTRELGMEDRVLYSSFNHYTCLELRRLEPEAYIGFLYSDVPIDMAAYAASQGADALHPAVYHLQQADYMEEATAHGLDVNVWTVNEPEHLHMACRLGLNAIITNYPDRALEIAGQYLK